MVILAMKVLLLKQLCVWWFFLSTILTVFLFAQNALGDNFLIYVFFDLAVYLIGRRIFLALYRTFDHQLLVEKMLNQSIIKRP